MQPTGELTRQHLDKIRDFYEAAPTELSRAARSYRGLLARYYNLLLPAEHTLTIENLLPTDTLWFYELVMTADDFTQ